MVYFALFALLVAAQVCTPQTITATSGTIDYTFPGSSYPDSTSCVWLIAPGAGALELSFSVIDIEFFYDALLVYDGSNAKYASLALRKHTRSESSHDLTCTAVRCLALRTGISAQAC
jgi:hypothetical protein